MIDLTLPVTIKTLTTPESQQLSSIFPDLPSVEKCITCRGKKSFRWYADPATRSEIVEYPCPCRDQWVLHRFFLNAGIPTNYQQLGWSDLDWIDPDAIARAREYLSDPGYVDNGFGLFLHGGKGTGKTLLMALVLKDLLVAGHDCYFTTFNAMLDVFTGGWHDADMKQWFHRRIKNAGILGIDDPGKEMEGRVHLPAAVIDEVLRHRVQSLRPNLITTNDSLGQFQARYGEYVLSLLRERATTKEFTGQDVRDQYRNRIIDEIKAGLKRPLVCQTLASFEERT